MQSVIVCSKNGSILQSLGQDLQIGMGQNFEVARLCCCTPRCFQRLGCWALHPCLEDKKPGFCLYILQLRLNCRDCDQLPLRPFAPDEYRSIRYDIHKGWLLKLIVLGLFPDQNAIII